MPNMIPARNFLAAVALAALPVFFAAPALAVPINQSADQSGLAGSSEPEAHFTNVIDDLPLMPGLQLVEDEDVLFDEPGSGRIAETNAVGQVDTSSVYNFYRRSLPHLGWKAIDTHTYERGAERLRIDAQANEKITTVKFTVKPVSGGR